MDCCVSLIGFIVFSWLDGGRTGFCNYVMWLCDSIPRSGSHCLRRCFTRQLTNTRQSLKLRPLELGPQDSPVLLSALPDDSSNHLSTSLLPSLSHSLLASGVLRFVWNIRAVVSLFTFSIHLSVLFLYWWRFYVFILFIVTPLIVTMLTEFSIVRLIDKL